MGNARVWRWLLALAVGVAMLATAGCFGSRNFTDAAEADSTSTSSSGSPSSKGVGAGRGNSAPDFMLRDLDGNATQLSQFKGKPVMMNFWATWCPPCRQEMPDMEKVYQKYRDQGFVFLGVDMKESADTVREFVKKNGYSWIFLLDSSGQVSSRYMVSGIPTTFFIDREGVIQDVQIGPMTPSVMEAKLSKIK